MGERRALPYRLSEDLESTEALDAPVRSIGRLLGPILASGRTREVLAGRWMGHAAHPLLTDVPIGAWTSSLILDFAGGRAAESAADLLIGVGVGAVAPTALTGWSDWCEASTKQQRVGLAHAAANITAAGLFTASLLKRREGRRATGKALSVLGASVLGIGGYLGGHLSYARGVGVEPQAQEGLTRTSPPQP